MDARDHLEVFGLGLATMVTETLGRYMVFACVVNTVTTLQDSFAQPPLRLSEYALPSAQAAIAIGLRKMTVRGNNRINSLLDGTPEV